MSLSSSVSADVRNEQKTKLNENEFANEKSNQDDETQQQLRFNSQTNGQNNANNENNNFKSTIDSTTLVDSSPSSKNLDLLDSTEKSAFSLTRLNEHQMVHGIIDQNNNNEYFSSKGLFILFYLPLFVFF